MATIAPYTSAYANFATMVGVYDSTLYGGVVMDTSANVGTGSLALNSGNSQYLLNTVSYTSPSATAGNGLTVTGWFYPTGTQATNATIFDICANASSVYLTCSTATNPTLTATYNTVSMTSSVPANLNAWNFYALVILCVGTTANQFLYLNGSLVASNTTATYSGGSVYNNNYIGYGPGLNYFNGKIDDFRFYTRVLTLPEINVLYQYNYQITAAPLAPTLAVTNDVATNSVGVNPIVMLDLSGTFSYVSIVRSSTVAGGSASYNLSCASLTTPTNWNCAVWTDVSSTLVKASSYTYTVTPYIMNTPGSATSITIST